MLYLRPRYRPVLVVGGPFFHNGLSCAGFPKFWKELQALFDTCVHNLIMVFELYNLRIAG